MLFLSDRLPIKLATRILLVCIAALTLLTAGKSNATQCDEFVAAVMPAKVAYQQNHRVYPVPDQLKQLALKHMPKLWVHPNSWQPIYFEDYLAMAELIGMGSEQVIDSNPTLKTMLDMTADQQCASYLHADEVTPRDTAPAYIQVYTDKSPIKATASWTYIKYNFVFDWSGLADHMSLISTVGVWLSGADRKKWHRLDIHVAAILVFDDKYKLRLVTLAQHNHQQTYLAGVDFPADERLNLVSAMQSNELYLDNGEANPVSHRVVRFFSDVAYLIDPEKRPWLWAKDITKGKNAGARQTRLHPVFLAPSHPLANFSGLLAPPKRLLGIYTGQDGPPGYDYYAIPAAISLVNFVAMGYWREGDEELLAQITPYMDGIGFVDTRWDKVISIMKKHLAKSMKKSSTAF